MGKKVNKTGRSHAEVHHVRIYHWLMKTAAWRHLGALERAVYLEIGSRFNGSNNGTIGYSIRDAAETFKVGKSTAARAFQMLQETGFIVCTTKGAFSVKNRRATEWRMTEFKCDATQELASKEFTRWSPTVPVVGQQKQNTVPVVGLTVPVVGQHGTHSGTMKGKKASDGTHSGTVTPVLDPLSVPVVGHIYSTSGAALQSEPSSSKPESSSSSLQPDSPKAKPLSKANLLSTSYLNRPKPSAQRRPS